MVAAVPVSAAAVTVMAALQPSAEAASLPRAAAPVLAVAISAMVVM